MNFRGDAARLAARHPLGLHRANRLPCSHRADRDCRRCDLDSCREDNWKVRLVRSRQAQPLRPAPGVHRHQHRRIDSAPDHDCQRRAGPERFASRRCDVLKLDMLVDDGTQQPTGALATGSAESLIFWDSIGRRGKNFVAGGPTQAEIQQFLGKPARQPLRVYVGLRSEETPQARAELALRELERVGGFERLRSGRRHADWHRLAATRVRRYTGVFACGGHGDRRGHGNHCLVRLSTDRRTEPRCLPKVIRLPMVICHWTNLLVIYPWWNPILPAICRFLMFQISSEFTSGRAQPSRTRSR